MEFGGLPDCSRPLLSRSGCICYGYELWWTEGKPVLVPFYRGAVVFSKKLNKVNLCLPFSSPFIEERLYLLKIVKHIKQSSMFSSPFIEERLYLKRAYESYQKRKGFSSPFIEERLYLHNLCKTIKICRCSRPLLSRSGCILKKIVALSFQVNSSRPLLSRSGCIST